MEVPPQPVQPQKPRKKSFAAFQIVDENNCGELAGQSRETKTFGHLFKAWSQSYDF
jgi:hypothetical protein